MALKYNIQTIVLNISKFLDVTLKSVSEQVSLMVKNLTKCEIDKMNVGKYLNKLLHTSILLFNY